MSKLPVISGRRLCQIFGKLDYFIDHRTGSHIILRQKDAPHRRLTVPDHEELAKGTLRAIIRQAGLTVGEFKELIKDQYVADLR